jgi:hypothetical protein
MALHVARLRTSLAQPSGYRLAQVDSGQVKKPKQRTASVSASEHGRAQAMIQQQQARIAELEEELAAARERIAELEAPR